MNEQLIVKNFGPIKDATVDFKKVTVFIGPTGGGKSTLAKLAAVLRDVEFYISGNGPEYLFDYYNLTNYFESKSELLLKRGNYSVRAKGRRITYDQNTRRLINSQTKQMSRIFSERSSARMPELAKTIQAVADSAEIGEEGVNDIMNNIHSLTDKLVHSTSLEIIRLALSQIFLYTHPHYIPSERIFVSSLNNSWAGLMRDDIGLPPPLLDFANNYAQFRAIVSKLSIPLFQADYTHSKGDDYIKIKGSKKSFNLHETASGIQSVTPLLVVLEHLSNNKVQAQSFIIEEPELNLYPTAQQGLLNWLVEKCTAGENDLTITTHSPYILASCNLLMEAYKVWQDRPELEAEIEKIIPRASWINPDEFAAYYVADGTVRSIKDERTDLIGGNELDAVSGNISDAFRSLLRLKKQPA